MSSSGHGLSFNSLVRWFRWFNNWIWAGKKEKKTEEDRWKQQEPKKISIRSTWPKFWWTTHTNKISTGLKDGCLKSGRAGWRLIAKHLRHQPDKRYDKPALFYWYRRLCLVKSLWLDTFETPHSHFRHNTPDPQRSIAPSQTRPRKSLARRFVVRNWEVHNMWFDRYVSSDWYRKKLSFETIARHHRQHNWLKRWCLRSFQMPDTSHLAVRKPRMGAQVGRCQHNHSIWLCWWCMHSNRLVQSIPRSPHE